MHLYITRWQSRDLIIIYIWTLTAARFFYCLMLSCSSFFSSACSVLLIVYCFDGFNGLFNALSSSMNKTVYSSFSLFSLKSLARANGIMTHSTIKMIILYFCFIKFACFVIWPMCTNALLLKTSLSMSGENLFFANATKSPSEPNVLVASRSELKLTFYFPFQRKNNEKNLSIDDLNKIRIRCFVATCVFFSLR